MSKNKSIGVVLSGCGHQDGTEIREAILTLLAIDKLGARPIIFAPDKPQYHVVNHLKSTEVSTEGRNVLEESARIARGKILALSDVRVEDLDALMIPGGFGVAKNLSTFALEGAEGKMDAELEKFLVALHEQHKPIGAICISPAVLCCALGARHPEVTIGQDPETAQAISQLGGVHKNCDVHQVHIDEKLKIVSTPAYMFDEAPISQVAIGIEACVAAVIKMI